MYRANNNSGKKFVGGDFENVCFFPEGQILEKKKKS